MCKQPPSPPCLSKRRYGQVSDFEDSKNTPPSRPLRFSHGTGSTVETPCQHEGHIGMSRTGFSPHDHLGKQQPAPVCLGPYPATPPATHSPRQGIGVQDPPHTEQRSIRHLTRFFRHLRAQYSITMTGIEGSPSTCEHPSLVGFHQVLPGNPGRCLIGFAWSFLLP